MKFGRQFDFHKIPEWSEFYLDYKELKKSLKNIQKIRRKNLKRRTIKKLKEEKTKQTKVINERMVEKEKFENHEQKFNVKMEIKNTQYESKNPGLKENLLNGQELNEEKIINQKSEVTYCLNLDENSSKIVSNIEKTISNSTKFIYESNIASINKSFISDQDRQIVIVENLNLENLDDSSVSQDEYKLEAIELRNIFLELYREKMKIVNDFYKNKLNEITNDYRKLKNKMDNKKQSFINDSSVVKDLNFSKNMQHSIKKENAERDELGFAVSWKRAISQLYNTASWLNSYLTINSIANLKILKKMERVFKNAEILSGKDEADEVTDSLNFQEKNEQVVKISKSIKDLYAEELTNGDKNKAHKELDERMRGTRYKDKIVIAFYSGMILCLLFTFFLLTRIPETTDYNHSILVFFPSFNFVFIIALILVGLAVNILIFRKYRINYIYIFEIDPNLRMGHNEIFTFLTIVWFILLVLTESSLSFHILTTNFYIYPMILTCFFTIFMLLPFHFFYYNFRKGIIITLIKNIFPIGKNAVRFRDFMFGDVLTSLTRPFATLCLSMCLLSCDKCRQLNTRETCTRTSISALVLILSPFIIRFFQCLNRFYYTRMAWPHLGNAVKYLGGITFNFFSWMFSVYKQEYFYEFFISACVANAYMLFWDIYMDWNLGRNFSNNFFLRDKIVYPKWMYYFAIITNSLLRMTWLTSLPGVNLYVDDEIKIFILSILEIYRRSQWALFRVENENTNNPEKYRTILDIPKLPIDD